MLSPEPGDIDVLSALTPQFMIIASNLVIIIIIALTRRNL
jgi:hypothetical protein